MREAHRIYQTSDLPIPKGLSLKNRIETTIHINYIHIIIKYLFEKLIEVAQDRGIKHVAHGANVDDVEDYSPGLQAAKELGIMAPLWEAGFCRQPPTPYSSQSPPPA